MAELADATFSAGGSKYSFKAYSTDTSFNDVSAVYIFTKRTVKDGKGSHSLLYIGETGELGTRIANHEKWDCVNSNGCNCICVHRVKGGASSARRRIRPSQRSRNTVQRSMSCSRRALQLTRVCSSGGTATRGQCTVRISRDSLASLTSGYGGTATNRRVVVTGSSVDWTHMSYETITDCSNNPFLKLLK